MHKGWKGRKELKACGRMESGQNEMVKGIINKRWRNPKVIDESGLLATQNCNAKLIFN